VVTADARRAALDRSRSAGADVVLAKPVTIDALDQALGTIAVLQQQARQRQRDTSSEPALVCSVCGAILLEDARGSISDVHFEQRSLLSCHRCGLQFVYGQTSKTQRRAG
jgi:hypothetical protein